MSEQETVLVVDDDDEVLDAATRRLEKAGYRTLAATNGESAVILAEACSPDGVLMDVQLPVMDGITALKEIKQIDRTKDIPVVMASSDESCRQDAKDAGAQAFVKKPYQGASMVKAVTTAVDEK